MTITIFYSTISMHYKPFAALAPRAVKSAPLPNLIFPIHSIECGIFCRLYQDLPRSGFKTPSWAPACGGTALPRDAGFASDFMKLRLK
jgi:hypothetical protein